MMSKTDRKTEYILDIATWRCGGGDVFPAGCWSLGDGKTSLLNEEGYMCCLGQFACQVVPEGEADVTGHCFPNDLAFSLGYVYDPNFVQPDGMLHGKPAFANTKLARDCAQINDNEDTTVTEKIRLLSKRLGTDGITLLIKNAHLLPVENEYQEDEDETADDM